MQQTPIGPGLDDLLNAPMEETENLLEQAVVPESPILPDSVREHIQNPPFIQEMKDKIDAVDAYAWARGSMGLDFGFESLNKAFNGFNPGLHLVAGGANTGKLFAVS